MSGGEQPLAAFLANSFTLRHAALVPKHGPLTKPAWVARRWQIKNSGARLHHPCSDLLRRHQIAIDEGTVSAYEACARQVVSLRARSDLVVIDCRSRIRATDGAICEYYLGSPSS